MSSSQVKLRNAVAADLPAILEMYNDAVLNLTATFDLRTLTLEERRPWFLEHGEKFPIIVAEMGQRLLGYCSISQFSKKAGYSPTVELSVYVHKNFRGKGIGRMLMEEIIKRARKVGYHAIISIIAGDNLPSVEIHKKLGFELVGHLKQVGYKFSAWQDVDYYELIL